MLLPIRRTWLVALLPVLMAACHPVYAQQPPEAARPYRAELTRNARAVIGLNAPVALFAAQVHQESAWRPAAVSRVGARGLTQFMPATAQWISSLFPELAAGDPFNPSWALRALVRYDDWLHARIRAADACQRWAMVLSAYNGGLGWIARDQALASSKGLDSLVWFGAVDQVNAGRSAANWRENRAYPQRIIYTHQALYASWGGTVCL
ncbi:transglycosylase SLT domain-containing protein [Castellaniella caeni]|uniref:transglycosylase SLT domain-containing protein n=1 Tax=Castellaniella caeni TaxID=266123 RepID=UPI000C9FE17D|nr:transglycosylase SLT domain-containing protein [Castellaniella caeni]